MSTDTADRIKLAKDPGTHQEILYYLAQNDPDAKVRRAVAANNSTPIQASPILAGDKDQDVRLALAERLVRLLPDLSADKHSQLYAFSLQALGMLALDEVLKVRMVLSMTLKDELMAPPQIVAQLARDIERDVSEPILRFCVALSDEDLLDILASHPASWAVQAIAARSNLSEAVSHAVADADDVDAGVLLLENKTSVITLATLGMIVEKAKSFAEWQRPMALRKNLPPLIAKKLASFVDQSVRTLLLERTDLDSETMEEITVIVRRRLDYIEKSENETVPAEERVRKMMNEKRLDESAITDAMGVRDKDFVIAALAALAKTTITNIENVIAMKAPKPLLAVCSKAGLSMRTAFQLQKELVHIPPAELIYPRGGTDYPIDKTEIDWQLDFLGIAKG